MKLSTNSLCEEDFKRLREENEQLTKKLAIAKIALKAMTEFKHPVFTKFANTATQALEERERGRG